MSAISLTEASYLQGGSMPKLHAEPAAPNSSRDRILAFLADHGGRVSSADGCDLTAAIAKEAGYANITALNAMLARMELDGLIEREVRGKRTYSVSSTRSGSPWQGRRNGLARPREVEARRVSIASPTFAQVDIALPELFAALGKTLVAMHEHIAELLERVAAVEELVKPTRWAKGHVA